MIDVIKEMEIPREYYHCTFDTWDEVKGETNASQVKQIQELAGERAWIIICGEGYGIGKTHLAVASMLRSWTFHMRRQDEDGSVWDTESQTRLVNPNYKELRISPTQYKFVGVRRLGVELIMAGIKMNDLLENHTSKHCLLLDELGRETDKAKTLIEILIDEVYSQRGQLIATSPFTEEQLTNPETGYDGAIIDRIVEKGMFVNLIGTSKRRRYGK